MPRRTRAEAEATASRILDAAVRLFGEHGYADVRLDEVAAAAGVTRGAVYHHYADKPGLFTAAADRVQARVGEAVARAAESVVEPWPAFVAGCRAFLTAAVDDAHRRILLVDAPAVLGWEAWRRQDAGHSARHLDEALADLAEAGLLTVSCLAATGALLSGAMNEAALWVAEQARPEALDEAVATLEVLLSSLRGAA